MKTLSSLFNAINSAIWVVLTHFCETHFNRQSMVSRCLCDTQMGFNVSVNKFSLDLSDGKRYFVHSLIDFLSFNSYFGSHRKTRNFQLVHIRKQRPKKRWRQTEKCVYFLEKCLLFEQFIFCVCFLRNEKTKMKRNIYTADGNQKYSDYLRWDRRHHPSCEWQISKLNLIVHTFRQSALTFANRSL